MIVLLLFICTTLLITLILIIQDIMRMTKDLRYINQNDTGGGLTTSSGLFFIKNLAMAHNISIDKMTKLRNKQEIQSNQFNKMMTNLAHDIKTPLTVSIGYIQLINKEGIDNQNERLKRVQNNLGSVNYYLNYLMDFNLIQEKNKNLNIKRINLSDILKKELFNYYDELSSKNIDVLIDIVPDIFVKSDEFLFKRIVQNLIGNISKYGNEEMKVSLKDTNDNITIKFKNKTKESINSGQNLLNRFYTSNNSKNAHSKGLGLSIVQSLVVTLGGKIFLNTQNNNFEIELVFKNIKF